jgi:hypothetical protein
MNKRFLGARGKGAALQPDMVFEFLPEQLHAALDQHGCAGHQCAVPRAFDEPTELQQAVEILLGPLSCSIFVISVARLIVPIRHGGHCPQLSALKKFENFSV